MLEIEIDGKKLTVPQGSTVMEAAHSAGRYIPHFCYHKKLSIAANCRMCLVEVEKAPKPLPACATPVTDGMKVSTHSELVKKAQAGVMEFLLINHPLDCPICDQGGECQLQDLAVGYGQSTSRYHERKLAVEPKEMGSLVSAEEMARCIHCTRCVRFTEEIGGFQEIGMANRGEHSEILPFPHTALTSEISGNVIDLCPVGALTSKPFRYAARSWELSRRKSISPHDGLGSNLIVQVKNDKVMRVLPLENEAINECWLSDRDRFSYEGLNAEERLRVPMIKYDGAWHETDWETALNYVVKGLKGVSADHGTEALGWLVSPHSTVEELYLAQKLARALGIHNIDYRLRRSDFSADGNQRGAQWLGCTLAELLESKSVLVIGSSLRQEQPLLSARLRVAARKGMQLNVMHVQDDNLLINLHSKTIVAPDQLAAQLKQVLQAVLVATSGTTVLDLHDVVPSPLAQKVATSLLDAKEAAAIVLGNVAQHHPAFNTLWCLSQEIARLTGAHFGLLAEAANSVGAELTGCVPYCGPWGHLTAIGLSAKAMLENPRKAYVLLNLEPEFDSYDPSVARSALLQAETVIALTAYKGQGLMEYADVLLPIAPFSETAGAFVNMEGRLQSFNGVTRPQGQVRPAWKVLRVLGNMLDLAGFDFETAEAVRREWMGDKTAAEGLNNVLINLAYNTWVTTGLMRLGEVPLYQADPLCRRAGSLQQTEAARPPVATASRAVLQQYGLEAGQEVLLQQQTGEPIKISIWEDDTLPTNVIRLAAAHALTQALGGMFDGIEIKQG